MSHFVSALSHFRPLPDLSEVTMFASNHSFHHDMWIKITFKG